MRLANLGGPPAGASPTSLVSARRRQQLLHGAQLAVALPVAAHEPHLSSVTLEKKGTNSFWGLDHFSGPATKKGRWKKNWSH